ncbi:relaxase/mobilization nuclease domain-containing protein, partial [Carboxylicivirga linearis]
MVIVMHQSVNTEAALLYNEMKVEKGKASFFHHRNTNSNDPFSNPKEFRLDTLRKIEASNKRTKNKCFHLSFNPGPEDMKRMSVNDLKKEMDRFMKQMGYGEQPYFVYHHKDIDREHFHLVSTRIDAHSFKKIKDNNEKRRVNAFINNLEESYKLNHVTGIKKNELRLPDDSTAHLYHRIQKTFMLLNESNISGKQQYIDALKGFNIELRNSERGQSVFVIDQNEETQRHPVPLSDLKVQPDFTLKSELTELEDGIIQIHKSKIESLLKALNKEYRFYTTSELKSSLFRSDYLLFQNSENNNRMVFSMKDKAVIDSQYLLKKYRSRLKDFVLTS